MIICFNISLDALKNHLIWVYTTYRIMTKKQIVSLFYTILKHISYLSRHMIFPTMWYVGPAKPQISLCICAAWSEPLHVAWAFYDCWATYRTTSGISKLKMRLHRLVWVYICHNATLLEITCFGSFYLLGVYIYIQYLFGYRLDLSPNKTTQNL